MTISNGVKIIVGLGNPGKQYKQTRHNAGWLALDFIYGDGGYTVDRHSHSHIKKISAPNGISLILSKPDTFMNDSGKTVGTLINYYNSALSTDTLIIHDDIDLPLGAIKTTSSASSAGHRGVQSVIGTLSSQDFHRIRIGIESREPKSNIPTDAFVLQHFSPEELTQLHENVFPKVKLEIIKFISK